MDFPIEPPSLPMTLMRALARRGAPIGMFVASIMASVTTTSPARGVKLHGPVIQWFKDPCTTASFSWVEEIAPDDQVLPVWRKGRAGFGYGDDDDSTVLGDMEGHCKRLYLATTFAVDRVSKGTSFDLGIRYDDAFIAYINGREVARSGNIRGAHAGAHVTDDHEADREEVFPIANAAGLLKPGQNLITIEGHNVDDSSSDFTLQPRLVLGGREVLRPDAEWTYLTGGDPSIRWQLAMPAPTSPSDLPMEEESEWTLSVRPRGSTRPFKAIDHKKSKFGETENLVFRAEVTGLQPGTAYDFNLSAGSRSLKTGWFRTAPRAIGGGVRFVVGGDMGTTSAIPVCRAVGQDDPLFVVVGGDLAYANGRSAPLWYDWIDNWSELVVAPDGRSIPIIAAIGNHETKSFSGLRKRELWKGLPSLRTKKSNAPYYFSLFNLPGGNSNFTVDFSDYMSFVVLDSGHSQPEKRQTGWLERELKERISVPHLFATYHEPAWGAGIKANNRNVQREWCPLFEKYQVDCVFENDHHTYKRSQPLTGGVRDEQRGILYLGDGAWGATLRPITERMLSREGARNYLAKWKSIHHVIRVTLGANGSRTYEAIDADRRVFDSHRDSKWRRGNLEAAR